MATTTSTPIDKVLPQYDDTISIKHFPSSFDLNKSSESNAKYGVAIQKPVLRNNIKYKSSIDHLLCPICQEPFIEPLTTICGHTFCKECIFECFKMAKDSSSGSTSSNVNGEQKLSGCCPLDRTPIDSANVNDLFPTPLLINNLIDDLKVYCMNYERGCEWVGSRWELEHHVLIECGHTGVRCNGKRTKQKVKKVDAEDDEQEEDASEDSEEDEYEIIRCNLIVERRFLNDDDSDEDQCIHKIFECNFCRERITKITQETHLSEECLFNYQTCDLCLNDLIPLKNLKKHQENCTKIGHIRCPAHEIGCKWIGSNQTSLEIHLQDTNCQLNQLLPSFQKMNDKIETLTNDNQYLQKQINKILDSIIQGKITNLGYNESIEEINKFNIEDQDKLLYLNFELDRLKFEINDKIIPFINNTKTGGNSNKESVINNLINDSFMMKEDLNLQRVLVNSLRKQLQFLLFTRNSTRIGGSMSLGGMPGTIGGSTNGSGLHSLDDLGNEIYDDISRTSSEERLSLNLKL
ncbi:hypothetical protein DFJ63DRAFT_332687 [Scheffersomyces coipomensis]|uniref:uncharacterized protein n=1 Tax=Scheffersomyces coipomensis TaxID=1788519 RepID=UPI00315C558B